MAFTDSRLEKYGPEPRTEQELVTRAARLLQATLPPSWVVEADVERVTTTRVDTWLTLRLAGEPVLRYQVEARRTATRGDLMSLLNQARLAVGSRLLVTRYLTPQSQDLLRERQISYIDAAGNIFLSHSDPLIVISERGATADPWRGAGRPTTSLKGQPAALLVRALADYKEPVTVPELARLAGASTGAAYRFVEYLNNEGLIKRLERGPITSVDWPDLLRRWSRDARFLDVNSTRGFLEPRGIPGLTTKLRETDLSERYAVSGSLAAQPYAPYAEPRLALLYTMNPESLTDALGLRPVESGANVIVASPRSPVVFARTTMWQGVSIVAPSQAVTDLLAGPGRNPAEGEFLLAWMKENTDAWRRQPDR